MNAASVLVQKIRLAIGGRPDVRIFRNNVGVAEYPDGTKVAYGLCPGSADLIGWRSIVISPCDVGRRLAVFVAVEAKSGRGRPTPEQLAFLEAVRKGGGIAGVAHSPEEAQALING